MRSLEGKVREVAEMASSQRGSRFRRFGRMIPPTMMADMMGIMPDDPIRLLLFASSCRDEILWVYELAMETYRVRKSGSPGEVREAV